MTIIVFRQGEEKLVMKEEKFKICEVRSKAVTHG